MVHQKDHRGLPFPLRRQDLIELVKTSPAINHIADHLKIAKGHVMIERQRVVGQIRDIVMGYRYCNLRYLSLLLSTAASDDCEPSNLNTAPLNMK